MVFVFMGLGLLLSKKLLTASADKVALPVGYAAATALLHFFHDFAAIVGMDLLRRRCSGVVRRYGAVGCRFTRNEPQRKPDRPKRDADHCDVRHTNKMPRNNQSLS